MTASSRRQFLASTAAAAAFGAAAGAGRSTTASTQAGGSSGSKDPAPPSTAPPAASPPRDATLERRQFGATDMKVSVLGFGGAEIGYQQVDQAIIDRLLNSALDAGLNVIDTAECYAGSEESIGKAVGGRRKDYWLFTKVGHMDPGDEGWTAASIARSIDRSLERLRTDHVDLVQLHSCGREVLERGECIEALDRARKAGKTRYIGYSGDSHTALHAVDSGRFDTLQISVSIVDQEAIDLVLPKAHARNMGVIAKRPIGNAVWRHDTEPTQGYVVEYWKRLQALDYPFAKGAARNDSSPNGAAGTALRFTLTVPGVQVAIVGTTKPERWAQNAAMLRAGGPLPQAEFDAIRDRWRAIAGPDWTGRT